MSTFTIDGIDYEESDDDDMSYKISTTEPNKIVEINKWEKEHHQLIITTTYESGYVVVDLEPYLEDFYKEEEGIDVNNSDFWINEEKFKDPTCSYKFLSDISKLQQEKIISIYENEFHDGLKEDGWDLKIKEIWFKGKLEIEKVDW